MGFVRKLAASLATAVVLSIGVLGTAGLLGACGQPAATCGKDNCAGCCKNTTCVLNTTDTNCGKGGDACATCADTETCSDDGACIDAPPVSCAGCIDADGDCAAGTSSAGCGTDGEACVACDSKSTCKSGRCESSTCTGCLDGTTCEIGNLNTKCGVGGIACVACTGGQACIDRKCGGTTTVTCNSTNCADGCCDINDTCQRPGTSTTACGIGGAACEKCGGSATCVNHKCAASCASTCITGCCDLSGACKTSVAATCGVGAIACVACGAGEICSEGKCLNTSCSATCPGCCEGNTCKTGDENGFCGIKSGAAAPACSHCVSPQVCAAHACGVDLASTWDLVLLTGDVPAENSAHANWDGVLFTYPDAYLFAELDFGLPTYQFAYSPSDDNTVSPDWGNEVVFSKVTAAKLLGTHNYFELFDDDGTDIKDMTTPSSSGDERMGWCKVTMTQAMFNGGVQEKVCSPSNPSSVGLTWKVRFKLVPHP